MGLYVQIAPSLETDSLIIRPFCLTDAQAMFTYSSDPTVSALTHWNQHTHLTQTKQFIRSIKNTPFWAIIHKETGALIGECGIKNIQKGSADLYCALAQHTWGKGIGTQASNALLDIGFSYYKLTTMRAWIIDQNKRSLAVAQKIGMTHETTLPDAWYTQTQLHDIHVYVITKN